ncbi:MAG: HD domain-containing phosphohydrolase [Usitatibacter sp.]
MGSALTDKLEALVLGSEPFAAGDLKTTLTRLSAELKHRFNKGAPTSFEFVSNAVKALSKIRGNAHADIRMICLYDSGAFLFANNFNGPAVACAKNLIDLARQAGNDPWLRKAHMLQGIAYSHAGDSGEAVGHFSTALELARRLGQSDGQISVLCNLGTSLNYCGMYREAIPCFLTALNLIQRYPEHSTYEPGALCNLAQSYLYLGEYRKGFDQIVLCLKKSAEPIDSFTAFARVAREYTMVQLALELGMIDLARKHSLLCTQFCRQSGVKRTELPAALCEALCEIHAGDVQRGLDLLERALDRCTEKTGIEYQNTLTSLVKAYDRASRPELALETLRTLIGSIRESREKGIMALLAMRSVDERPFSVATEGADLRELADQEARLRVQVAERELVSSRLEMLERLATTADLKEEESGEHGYRVGKLSGMLSLELGQNKETSIAIEMAARLHDIGKIAVPDRILLNSQELQQAERHFISTHTLIGAELLSKSNVPQLKIAEEIARFHHEWWNGEGYPTKLAGKRIPIHARIVALADVFDALTHGRPFSKPWPMDQAIEEIQKRRGTQFDPELTDVFLKLIDRLRNEHADLDEYLGRAGRNSPFLQARNKIRLMLAEERENEKKATVEGNETRH